jgi:hypothetical protein
MTFSSDSTAPGERAPRQNSNLPDIEMSVICRSPLDAYERERDRERDASACIRWHQAFGLALVFDACEDLPGMVNLQRAHRHQSEQSTCTSQ